MSFLDSKDGTADYDDPVTVRADFWERKARRALRDAERFTAKAEQMRSLPDEPEAIDADGNHVPNVIWFEKSFDGGHQRYTYAAVKAGDGRWYTSGPKSQQGYGWSALIAWIMQDPSAEIWQATTWELFE